MKMMTKHERAATCDAATPAKSPRCCSRRGGPGGSGEGAWKQRCGVRCTGAAACLACACADTSVVVRCARAAA